MNFRILNLIVGVAVASGTARAESEAYQPAPDDAAKVHALAARLLGELADKCPVKPVGDQAAYINCRDALFNGESVFRSSLKRFVLWGRPLGGDINATLKDFRATQFGNDVFTGTYAPFDPVSFSLST